MNIVFIINMLESIGGTERVASLLANQLSDFYDITILSRQHNSEKNAYRLDERVEDIKFTGSNVSFISQCRQHLIQHSPDLVVIHTMSKLTPALLIGGIKAKKIWSIEHISFEFHSVLFKILRKRLYKKIDKVITLTEVDSLNYKKFHKDVTVVANATPLSLKKEPATDASRALRNVVSIGRLTSQKGFDLLIEAWSLVESKHPNWSLNIYGEGEDRSKLEKMIADKNLNNITLKGLTNDVQAVYDNAAFYVMSSRYEGFGLVLIEAQSRGLPTISFDCASGPAEIIEDGVNGYLVKNLDIEMLSNRIIYLIENQSVREVFSSNALISAKRFEPKVIIKQWIALIENECEYNVQD